MSASSEASSEPITTASLRFEHFAPLVEQTFTLYLPDGKTLQLQLFEATSSRHAPPPGFRPSFSLLFRCPELPPGRYIQQGGYVIEHAALGKLDYFMTPLQPDQQGMRYECVFG